MKTIFVILVLLGVTLSTAAIVGDPECVKHLANDDFVAYVKCLSYPVETHEVVTDDGYKLTLFRIQAKNSQITSGKAVVLLQHGLFDSSDSWVSNVEELAPAFVLANKGHDVWLGNSRGNRYSLGHKSLDHSKDAQYWAFSWQHMAQYDLPAIFTYISHLTNQKINYVGHSQGTTQMFAALTHPSGNKHPAIKNNLRKFAALGPVAYLGHTRSILLQAIAKTPLLPQLIETIFRYGLFNYGWLSSEAAHLLCTDFSWVCALGVGLVADIKSSEDDQARLAILAGHFPAGTSVQDILHWKQLIENHSKFTMYDYGKTLNNQIYGQPDAPVYNPKLLTEEVALFVGNDDEVADHDDATNWYNDLASTQKQIHYYTMGHLTFLIGKNPPYLPDLIQYLDLPTYHTNFLE